MSDARKPICLVGVVTVRVGDWGHIVIREGVHTVVMKKEESIAAARAILAHFGEE